MLKLIRHSKESIFKKNKNNYWEAAAVFNAAAIKENGKVNLIYRSTDKNSNGRECSDYMNYLGLAISDDGISFERGKKPLMGPIAGTFEARGLEDPRVVKIDDVFYMTYTGFGGRYDGDFRICLATSKDLLNWERRGIMLDEVNKDAALFPRKINGEYVLIHRRAPHIWIGYSEDLKEWYNHKILAYTEESSEWENYKIGLAGPPIEFENGWALIYHGVSKEEKEIDGRGKYKKYSLGIMLLDKEDPSKVIYRQNEPILEPELKWELEEGCVPNVVFSCGQVIIDDELFVYYGGADTEIGLATCKISEIDDLFKNREL